MNTRIAALPCVAVALITLSGCGTVNRTAETEQYIDTVATVRGVDLNHRLIALETANGGRALVQVGDEVKDLSEVKPGDQLRVRYSQAVAAHVVKAAEPQIVSRTQESERDFEPGSRPAMKTQRETRALFRVESIDTGSNAVVVTGPNGLQRVVHVQTPEMQEYIRTLNAGDTVEVTYTEATAVSIERP